MITSNNVPYRGPVPNQPATPKQNMRIGGTKWSRFGAGALKQGTNRTEVVNQFIDWYLRVPGAELPERPSEADIEWIASTDPERLSEIVKQSRRRPELDDE